MTKPHLVAADACLIITLSKFFDENINDGGVRKFLDEKRFDSKMYIDMPKKNWPELLRDEYIGRWETTPKGKEIFANLFDLQRLKNMIVLKQLQLVVTPTVYNELRPEKNTNIVPFLERHCKIVTIEDKVDAIKFYGQVNDLAEKYVKFKAMSDVFSARNGEYVPENDAYIMAEASVLGLHLITLNAKDFMKTKFATNNDRVRLICEINDNFGHRFNSEKENRQIVARPFTPNLFLYLHEVVGVEFCNHNIGEPENPKTYVTQDIKLQKS